MTIVDSPVTIVDSPVETTQVDEAQLLFQEARRRRRRRWLISGIVSMLVIAAFGIVLSAMVGQANQGPSPSVAVPSSAQPAAGSGPTFSVRPVLCFAPPLTLPTGLTATTGALPTCAPSSALTAANIGIEPFANGYAGTLSIPADPQFATYASTSPRSVGPNRTVLLPGLSSTQGRFVLGPAGLTGGAIKSASVQRVDGQWLVNIVLNSHGASQWDALARTQFHAMIGIVLNSRVISAPITQPLQSSFTSFEGRMQISGGLTEHQAKSLAAQL